MEKTYDVRLEFCMSWGYHQKAARLAERMLDEFDRQVKSIEMIPSSGGIFEVTVNDELVFSKKSAGRFPDPAEVIAAMAEI